MSYIKKNLQQISSPIYKPSSICIDSDNNIIIVQSFYRCILKIDFNGIITDTIGNIDNIIGDIDDTFENSRFKYIVDICCDTLDNLYILDSGNNKIRYVNFVTKKVTTFLENFENLNNIVIDNNNNLYVSTIDYNNNGSGNIYIIDQNKIQTELISNLSYINSLSLDSNNIYVISNNELKIYTLNGVPNGSMSFQSMYPNKICIDNNLVIYFTYNHYIYGLDLNKEDSYSIFSGSESFGFLNSTIQNSLYYYPNKILIKNNIIYVSDGQNNMIRKIDISNNTVSTIIGNITYGLENGNINNSIFNNPYGLVYNNNNMYLCDTHNNQIRKYNLHTNDVSLYSGDLNGNFGSTDIPPKFNSPAGICIDTNNTIYITDYNNASIRSIDIQNNVTTIANLNNIFTTLYNTPSDIKIDNFNNLFIVNQIANNIIKIPFINSSYDTPYIFAGDSNGTSGYFNGNGLNVRFNYPNGLIIDSKNNIFISDTGNNVIRKITQNGDTTTFCGIYNINGGYQDGNANSAIFNGISFMTIDSNDNIYICDSANGMIRKINTNGYVTTLIYGYRQPHGIIMVNNDFYVTDYATNLLTKLHYEPIPCVLYNTNILVYSSNGNIVKKIQNITTNDFIIGTISNKPIKVLYSGYKIVDIDRLNEYTLPTKIPKDFFESNVPSKDLYISNNHLICIENYKNKYQDKIYKKNINIINQNMINKLNININNTKQKRNIINAFIKIRQSSNYILPFKINEIKQNTIKTIEEIENITGLNQLRYYHIMLENNNEGFYANNVPVESLQSKSN